MSYGKLGQLEIPHFRIYELDYLNQPVMKER